MAITISSVDLVERGAKQFQGAFKEMWAVSATIDPASVAAGAEDTGDVTVPGLALGDMVIAWECPLDWTSTGEASIDVWVSAANTLSIRITNLHASSAVDLASAKWKFLIGRPSW